MIKPARCWYFAARQGKSQRREEMAELEVRIVELEPMRVASALGFGPSPEEIAWEKILAFAQERNLLARPHRFFGFNNPSPSPGSPNYGYEQWITVGPEVTAAAGVEIKDFAGGRYAVTRCAGVGVITETWQRLVLWQEDSPYRQAHHQWLEECLTPPGTAMEGMIFDLYLPVGE
jgi:DNA gyrase inhibitor GyrI